MTDQAIPYGQAPINTKEALASCVENDGYIYLLTTYVGENYGSTFHHKTMRGALHHLISFAEIDSEGSLVADEEDNGQSYLDKCGTYETFSFCEDHEGNGYISFVVLSDGCETRCRITRLPILD